MYLSTKPLYAFGYGLSYTKFAYSNLRVSSVRLARDGSVTVSMDVRNTGARDGDEVVQLYVAHVGSAVTRPQQELKAFRRVTIYAGETRTVSIPLKASSLAYWDGKAFAVESDNVDIRVGGSSDAIALHKQIKVGD
jgi:beta-glucosidase